MELVVDKKVLILRPVAVFYFTLLAQTRVQIRHLNRINLRWISITPDNKFALFNRLFMKTPFVYCFNTHLIQLQLYLP